MADSLLTALMGPSAQERLANDPFYVGGTALQRQQIAPTNNWEAVLIPALQGLASGGMQGYGRSNVASSMASNPLLDALKVDRSTLDTSDPFKVETALSQALLENQLKQQNIKSASDAIGGLSNQRDKKQLVEALLKSIDPNLVPPGPPSRSDSSIAAPNESSFDKRGSTVDDVWDQAMNKALNSDFATTPGQAGAYAEARVKEWQRREDENRQLIEALRGKSTDAYDLAARTEASAKAAGVTGSTVRDVGNYILSSLPDFVPGAADQLKKYTAGENLSALKPDTLKQNFQKGMGPLSDTESRAVFGSGPSAERTQQFNLDFANRMELVGKLSQDYADLMQETLSAGGTKEQAQQLWNQYKRENRLVNEDSSVNVGMPSFTDWLSSKSGGQGGGSGILGGPARNDSPIITKTLKDGSTVQVRQLPDGSYEEVS